MASGTNVRGQGPQGHAYTNDSMAQQVASHAALAVGAVEGLQAKDLGCARTGCSPSDRPSPLARCPGALAGVVTYRRRRSRVSATDPGALPVVATLMPASWPAILTDNGTTPWDPALRLVPWAAYSWRVEVQGPPEPGSSVPTAGVIPARQRPPPRPSPERPLSLQRA